MWRRRDGALALMQEIVGSDPLDATTTLSDVGFDSLAFAELAAAVEDELGLDLTAADLNDLLGRRGPPSRRPCRTTQDRGRPPPRDRSAPEAGEGARRGSAPVMARLGGARGRSRSAFWARGPRDEPRERAGHPHGFRVDRERFDLVAVRIGIAALSRGHVLGMYPEGTRAPGELLSFLHGALGWR